MNYNTKTILGLIFILIAFITLIIAAIWSIVFQFQNPDMTELRLLIENPYPTVVAIISLIGFMVGKTLIGIK